MRRHGGGYRAIFFSMTILIYILNYADRRLLSVLATPVKQELHLSDGQLGFLLGPAFVIFYSLMGLPLGRLADVLNRRLLLCLCVGAWSLMTSLTGLAPTFTLLALARFGIGVGEAGMQPCVYSMISDMYPAQRRATASATFALGLPLGSMIAFVGAGWLERTLGWRGTFGVMGAIGLGVALLAYACLSEPERGGADEVAATDTLPSLSTTIRELWSIRSYRHMAVGTGFCAMAYDAAAQWSPSFLGRVYHMSLIEIGSWLGPALGVGGCLGIFLGGYLSDILRKRDIRWMLWLPALAVGLTAVPTFLAYYSEQKIVSMIMLLFPLTLCPIHSAPFVTTVLTVTSARTRGVALGIALLVATLIGFGLGTQLIGFLSDAFQTWYGSESLRYALLVSGPTAAILAAVFYYLGSKTLRENLQVRTENRQSAILKLRHNP